MEQAAPPELLDVLQRYWGYSSFREPQAQVIQALLAGEPAGARRQAQLSSCCPAA